MDGAAGKASGDDEQVAHLATVLGRDVNTCRAALARAGGDLDLAAQLVFEVGSEVGGSAAPFSGHAHLSPAEAPGGLGTAATAGALCAACGAADVGGGRVGEGDHEGIVYCGPCWRMWEADAEGIGDGGVTDRFLGLIEGADWEELGAKFANTTAERRRVPLERMGRQLAYSRGGRERWRTLAEQARRGVEACGALDLTSAAAFLRGAAGSSSLEHWQVLTIYEMQVEELLADRKRRLPADGGEAGPVAAGCTGLACGSTCLVGQTEEVDVDVYDYGAQDVVARLRPASFAQAALVYDPACTFCPIGLGPGGLCVTRYTLCPRQEMDTPGSEGAGLPLAAILWELLLGSRNLPQAIELLRGLFAKSPAPMLSGASIMLSQPGHGIVLVEWSRSKLWVSPVANDGVLVHANHCVLGSTLIDTTSAALQHLLGESKWRQAEVEDNFAKELLAGQALSLSLPRLKASLSLAAVQNDHVLSTIVVSPLERVLHVRFRLQNRGMQLAEETVDCDFWQCFADEEEPSEAAPRGRWRPRVGAAAALAAAACSGMSGAARGESGGDAS